MKKAILRQPKRAGKHKINFVKKKSTSNLSAIKSSRCSMNYKLGNLENFSLCANSFTSLTWVVFCACTWVCVLPHACTGTYFV